MKVKNVKNFDRFAEIINQVEKSSKQNNLKILEENQPIIQTKK